MVGCDYAQAASCCLEIDVGYAFAFVKQRTNAAAWLNKRARIRTLRFQTCMKLYSAGM